jgi:hypothetical protein
MHVSRPVVSKAENPIAPIPSAGLLAAWAGATGAALDELTELAKRCRSGSPEWFMPYAAAEVVATMLRCWGPLIVPGLLQVEAYARAILGVEPYTPERLDELVKARMERHRVLDRAQLIAIIDHSVLQLLIGSAQVMAEQCGHLVAMAERPNISLHVIPPNTNHGVWGGLDIASRDGVATVSLSTGRTDVTTRTTDLADSSVQAFERLLGYAMPPEASLDFLRTQEGHWKDQI